MSEPLSSNHCPLKKLAATKEASPRFVPSLGLPSHANDPNRPPRDNAALNKRPRSHSVRIEGYRRCCDSMTPFKAPKAARTSATLPKLPTTKLSPTREALPSHADLATTKALLGVGPSSVRLPTQTRESRRRPTNSSRNTNERKRRAAGKRALTPLPSSNPCRPRRRRRRSPPPRPSGSPAR